MFRMRNAKDRIQAILTLHHLRPRHYLGQNFLISDDVYDRIIKEADLSTKDRVVEIGGGLGTLTMLLAQHAGFVTTVERDVQLASILKQECKKAACVTVLTADILALSIKDILRTFPTPLSSYKVVANLPYQITAKTLDKFLHANPKPTDLIFMVQREVADRITAQPGHLSMIALMCQMSASIEKICDVPATAFYPEPKVTSALVHLRTLENPRIALPKGITEQDVLNVARIGFSKKRKMLINTLAATWRVSKEDIKKLFLHLGISPSARPQELTIPQWAQLAFSRKS
jgi:16S rRNA (adenine1518-N6/adenine1519-N6)-dimethyltransferase